MKNINKQIWRILSSDLTILKDLSRGIINIRALAKYVLKTYKIKASLDAVISAVRRYDIKRFEKHEEITKDIFKGALVATRSNLTCITVSNIARDKLPLILKQLSKTARTFNAIEGTNEFKLIIDNQYVNGIKKRLNKDIKYIEPDLGEVRIILKKKAIKTIGILTKVSSEISLREINIEDIIVCSPEIIILVKQKDLLKAHESLVQLVT